MLGSEQTYSKLAMVAVSLFSFDSIDFPVVYSLIKETRYVL